MTGKAFTKAYTELGVDAEVAFLARLAHLLTVVARDTYIPQTEAIADPVRLRRINEFQHRITGRLVEVKGQGKSDWAVGEFAGYLVAGAKDLGCPGVLAEAMRQVHGRSRRRAVA